jgi:hypothetical protein
MVGRRGDEKRDLAQDWMPVQKQEWRLLRMLGPGPKRTQFRVQDQTLLRTQARAPLRQQKRRLWRVEEQRLIRSKDRRKLRVLFRLDERRL